MKKTKIEKLFGSCACTDDILKKFMPKQQFAKYILIKENGENLDIETAGHIARAIKEWAITNGVTHYSHWFMPLTNKTAEKQVSFVEINNQGKLIEELNAKALIKGETDASSFPNGGDRVTFEARGYTVWDYTSPAFIKEDNSGNKVVYIPTAFCSYNGTALDDKTPLLRAIESLNTQSLRVLKCLGYSNIKKVNLLVGAEQEYFLIKSKDYQSRLDLKLTGRTLLGQKPIKTQEQNSHYFGMIEDSVSKFMNEVDKELWAMGITAKIQHNEVAPCQHEFVPIFNSVNVASDQNQIVMQVISKIARRNGYEALFHEKPFSYINGSGKHINISLATDTGINLFDFNQKDSLLFNTFFISMISAIDNYYSLIRLSTAYYGNDFRLGGDEAPPTIVSVFASDYVLDYLKQINSLKKKENKYLDTGVKILPKMEKDYCDRNRTSPFAFTGNKFEFRMVGASQSISWPSVCICTALSMALKDLADLLEKETNPKEKILSVLNEILKQHERIIFNGNGYDNEWKIEAKNRGLIEYPDSLSIYNILDNKEIIDLFEITKVLDKSEISLRKSTLIKNYIDTAILEAKTLSEILNKYVFTSLNKAIEFLTLNKSNHYNKHNINIFNDCLDNLFNYDLILNSTITEIENNNEVESKINIVKNKLIPTMKQIRQIYDNAEKIIPDAFEPFPTYNDILYY